ncbi:MAG: RagB/SusD family nutrient uptake outer membrane protein [Lepagella sp.]
MTTIKPHHILAVLLLAVLTSCNDWLDPQSEVDPDRNTLLKSPEGIEDAFIGIYASMSHKDLYGRALTYYIPSILAGHYGMVGTDIEHWLKYPYDIQSNAYSQNAIIEIDRIWSRLYFVIANANSIIEYTQTADPDEQDGAMRHAKGEALAIRAFIHFELLRYFAQPFTSGADSPAIPYMDGLTATARPMLTNREIVERIILDLDHALELTADSPDHDVMRFGHTAILATLARVYLYAGDFDQAYIYANKVLNYHPESISWYDPHAESEDHLLRSELIFALNISRLNEYAAGWILPGGIGRKNTIMVLTQAGEYYFNETDDIREKLWIVPIGYDRYCNKFDLSSTLPLMPMIRLSEMAYIAAETASSQAQGIACLNLVRSHRNLAPLPDDNSINLIDELAKEYQREFLCEGQLWHFYKRKLYRNIPGNSYFNGRLDLYTFPIPEDESIFGNVLK